MTAHDAISPLVSGQPSAGGRSVETDMPLVDVLPRLLDAPGHRLDVTEGGMRVGTIDETSFLQALGGMLSARDDSSVVTLECNPEDYSASLISHAVEDVGVHLVDLWSAPAPEGHLRVTLRVRCEDPTSVVRSLERYGYAVTDVYGRRYAEAEIGASRMRELQLYLNV